MRRWTIYALAAFAVLLLPKGQEKAIGKLLPVELIYIYKETDRTLVQTDTGDIGQGDSLTEALADLRMAASGEVFLDTAEYILVTEEARKLLQEAETVFRLSAQVVLATGKVDPQIAAQYLSAHRPGVTLKDHLMLGEPVPKLMTAGERYYLE